MASFRQPDPEVSMECTSPSRRSSERSFRRLLSTDSSASSIRLSSFDLSAWTPRHRISLRSPEFLLKLLQLITAIVCAGLYSNGIRLMQHSIESKMFPNIVFSAFIIITSVIALGYVLGHIMPAILIRIFNIIGTILYFVSACVTTLDWYRFARFQDQPEDIFSAWMLLAQACLSFVNSILYGYDLYLGMKKAFTV